MANLNKMEFTLCEMNPTHIPKDEYDKIFQYSSKDSPYCFFTMFFDEGLMIYLFATSASERFEKTQEDFPVFYYIIKPLIEKGARFLLIYNPVPTTKDLQIYEH